MNLFTKSLSLLYLFSLPFCAATGDNSSIGNTELDFLNDNDLKLVGLTNDVIKEAFCLDEEHKKHKQHMQLVNEFLGKFLGDQESKLFSLCIMKRFIEFIQKENNVSFIFLQKTVSASDIKGITRKKKKLNFRFSLLYFFILQFTPNDYSQCSLWIDSLYVEVEPKAKSQSVETGENSGTTSQGTILDNARSEEKVFSGGSTSDDVLTVTSKFEEVKKDVIGNLEIIMKGLKEVSKEDIYVKLIERNTSLDEKEIDEIIAILPKTILSEKFSITKNNY